MTHALRSFSTIIILTLSITYFSAANNLDQCKTFTRHVKDATISVDPRIELFQIFNMMAGNPNINSVETSYKTAIIDYFDEYKNHPSLNYYRNNFQKFFNSIDAPYPFLLSLNLDFTFRSDLLENDWQTKDIDALLKAMSEFASDTNFDQFFNSQQNFYNLVLMNTVYFLDDFDERSRMLDYYGIDRKAPHEFKIVLNILGMGNFGPGIKLTKGFEHYAIVSTGRDANGIPVYSKGELENLIWHEFGHSFTNTLIDKYWNDLNKLNGLYEPIKESMKAQVYGTWKTVLYEHMTRAIQCRLAANKYTETFMEFNQYRYELGRGFIYCKPIIDELKKYEISRNIYPTLDSFMPVIIDRMKQISKDSIDSWMAMVQRIRQPNVDDIPESSDFFKSENKLIILSTAEYDKSADNELKEYLASNFPDIPTLFDTVALRQDLSEYDLMAIGTPNGNSFIKKYMGDLPVKMTSDELIAGNIYRGTGYALMTGWVHPQNSSKVMTLYIAQNPKDLINFAWVRRGGTDYHIMKNLVTLKAGDYSRRMEMWICN